MIMVLVLPTPRWTQRTLVSPCGLIRNPLGTVLDVDSDMADWLIAERYAEPVSQSQVTELEKEIPAPPSDSLVTAFVNDSTLVELTAIKGLSAQIAKELVELRPLTDEDLRSHLSDRQYAALQKHLA